MPSHAPLPAGLSPAERRQYRRLRKVARLRQTVLERAWEAAVDPARWRSNLLTIAGEELAEAVAQLFIEPEGESLE